MDLSGVRPAVAVRPRVLVVPLPGAARVRLAAERELRLRDLPVALTPADTDLLLVAGPVCAGLEPAVERLWQDVPAPRSRVRATTAAEVAGVLDAGCAQLADRTGQRAAAGRGTKDKSPNGRANDRPEHGAHGPPAGHSGHGGHGGHGDGGAAGPAGRPTARPGPDRDGLVLDRLHISLGPVLADWPAGLALRLTVQGDVIQRAEPAGPGLWGTGGVPFWTEPWSRAAAGERVRAGEAARRRAAAHLDSLNRFLEVAGWPSPATEARRLRDDLLDGSPATAVLTRAERLARRVGRSRTLHWLTRGIGHLSRTDAREAGVTGPAARANGDVSARYRHWLSAVLADLGGLDDPAPLDPAGDEGPRGPLGGQSPPSLSLVRVLPRLLEGAELASARLIVASLDPDTDELLAPPAEVTRG